MSYILLSGALTVAVLLLLAIIVELASWKRAEGWKVHFDVNRDVWVGYKGMYQVEHYERDGLQEAMDDIDSA